MKKYLIIIVVIILLLAILFTPVFSRQEKLCADYANGEPGTCEDMITVRTSFYELLRHPQKPTDVTPQTIPVDTKTLEKEIRSDLMGVNYCERDSDCIVHPGYGCPFGCYELVNKDADMSSIDEKVDQYSGISGPRCIYDCDRNPTAKEIACVNNKCIDLRYPN